MGTLEPGKMADIIVLSGDLFEVDKEEIREMKVEANYFEGEKIYGLFNFSEYDKTAWINERDGLYKDLITGQEMEAAGVNVPAYGFFWLKKK